MSKNSAQDIYEAALEFDDRIDKENDPSKKEKLFGHTLSLYKQAADMGHIKATHNFAIKCQLCGNIPQAISYYKKSADAGYDSSQCNLGTIYLGIFDKKYTDLEKALSYLTKAADQNNRGATQNLVKYYQEQGNPLAEEYEKKLAALPGDDALRNIAVVPVSSSHLNTSTLLGSGSKSNPTSSSLFRS